MEPMPYAAKSMPTLRFHYFMRGGALYRYRAGIPWRDLPERFGDWKNTHRRLRRWCESGVFARIFKTLSEDRDNEYMMIGGTIVSRPQGL